MDILKIGSHDYSSKVKTKGLGWSRNDVDDETTTRLKNGDLRRKKLTTKRKISYSMTPMSQEELAQLDNDLSLGTFDATYLDLHGVQTRTFYCSSLSTTVMFTRGDVPVYGETTFSIIEV